MSKKWRILSLIVLLPMILGLVACGGKDAEEPEEVEEDGVVEEVKEDEAEEEQDEARVVGEDTLDKLDYTIEVYEDGGSSDIECTYTNNSEYTFSRYEMTLAIEGEDEEVILENTDVVKPGDKSLIFDASGFDSISEEDIEVVNIFGIFNKGGKEYFIQHEVDTDTYHLSEK